jgi:hypothetical protein
MKKTEYVEGSNGGWPGRKDGRMNLGAPSSVFEGGLLGCSCTGGRRIHFWILSCCGSGYLCVAGNT